MTPSFKTNDKQDLLQKVYNKPRGTMPAKSISWRWGDGDEQSATEAEVTYNRKPIGTIKRDRFGEFQGRVEFEVEALDGTKELIIVETYEGFDSIKMVGNQLYYKMKRECQSRGFHWPW